MQGMNPQIFEWARSNAGLTLEEAAHALGIASSDRLKAIEDGSEVPTRPLLLKMSKQYRRSLLTFYLAAPPKKGDRGQDFRTLPPDRSLSGDALLDALIRDLRARQSLVRATLELEEEQEPLAFIGSAQVSDDVAATARTPVRSPWYRDMGYGGGTGCDTIDFGPGTATAKTVTAVYPYSGQTGVPLTFLGAVEGQGDAGLPAIGIDRGHGLRGRCAGPKVDGVAPCPAAVAHVAIPGREHWRAVVDGIDEGFHRACRVAEECHALAPAVAAVPGGLDTGAWVGTRELRTARDFVVRAGRLASRAALVGRVVVAVIQGRRAQGQDQRGARHAHGHARGVLRVERRDGIGRRARGWCWTLGWPGDLRHLCPRIANRAGTARPRSAATPAIRTRSAAGALCPASRGSTCRHNTTRGYRSTRWHSTACRHSAARRHGPTARLGPARRQRAASP